MKAHPNQIFLKRGDCSLWLARKLEGEIERYLLGDPDLFFSRPGCEIVKDQRKTKVGRAPFEIGGKTRRLYLKRYNSFSWRSWVGSLFVPSSAMRSWAGAQILMEAGFLTGEPIAAIECRSWGGLIRSFYLSEEIPQGKTLDSHWRQELLSVRGAEGFHTRREFLGRLARLVRSLHDRDIYHNDLKDVNIVVSPRENAEFYLLDLEGVRRYRHLKKRRQIKNLVQLNRTMGPLMRRVDRLYWLKIYLGNTFTGRRTRRWWVGRVLHGSRRAADRSLRKKTAFLRSNSWRTP